MSLGGRSLYRRLLRLENAVVARGPAARRPMVVVYIPDNGRGLGPQTIRDGDRSMTVIYPSDQVAPWEKHAQEQPR
jgi:hypothetical protein